MYEIDENQKQKYKEMNYKRARNFLRLIRIVFLLWAGAWLVSRIPESQWEHFPAVMTWSLLVTVATLEAVRYYEPL